MRAPTIVFSNEAENWVLGDTEVRRLVKRSVDAACKTLPAYDLARWEIGVTLTEDARIQSLNREHRGQDKPTNVLSFPIDRPDAFQPSSSVAAIPEGDLPDRFPDRLMGDIVLAAETIQREAAEKQVAPGDHLTHLVIHGLLHLLGYDHEEESEAVTMERLETEILAGLGIANPHAEPHMPIGKPKVLEAKNA